MSGRATANYLRYASRFESWRVAIGRDPGEQVLKINSLDCLNATAAGGAKISGLETTAAAVVHLSPGSTEPMLKRAMISLSGWRKWIHPKSRLPLGADIVAAIGAVRCQMWWHQSGLLTAFSMYTYLRPCEAHALRNEDLAAPVGGNNLGIQHWTLAAAPAERAEMSKVGVSDDTMSWTSRGGWAPS